MRSVRLDLGEIATITIGIALVRARARVHVLEAVVIQQTDFVITTGDSDRRHIDVKLLVPINNSNNRETERTVVDGGGRPGV